MWNCPIKLHYDVFSNEIVSCIQSKCKDYYHDILTLMVTNFLRKPSQKKKSQPMGRGLETSTKIKPKNNCKHWYL